VDYYFFFFAKEIYLRFCCAVVLKHLDPPFSTSLSLMLSQHQIVSVKLAQQGTPHAPQNHFRVTNLYR
jgi:hypothetical protein